MTGSGRTVKSLNADVQFFLSLFYLFFFSFRLLNLLCNRETFSSCMIVSTNSLNEKYMSWNKCQISCTWVTYLTLLGMEVYQLCLQSEKTERVGSSGDDLIQHFCLGAANSKGELKRVGIDLIKLGGSDLYWGWVKMSIYCQIPLLLTFREKMICRTTFSEHWAVREMW